jgi:hypothetical protein
MMSYNIKITDMKKFYVVLFLVGISFLGFAQSGSVDSLLKPNVLTYTYQQTESINVYYDNLNSRFVIENNTKQIHNFYIGIYNLTGTPIQETKKECMMGKNIEIPINLNPGLYIINVIDKPIVFTKKIIIQ